MPDIKSLATNPTKSVEGVEVDYYGIKLKIAREGNPTHVAAQQRVYLENAATIQAVNAAIEAEQEGTKKREEKEKEGDAMANRIEAEIMAEGLLKGWSNVTDNGVELEYSVELGKKYLADPEYDDMRQFIARVARNRAQYQAHDVNAVTEMVKDQSDS